MNRFRARIQALVAEVNAYKAHQDELDGIAHEPIVIGAFPVQELTQAMQKINQRRAARITKRTSK